MGKNETNAGFRYVTDDGAVRTIPLAFPMVFEPLPARRKERFVWEPADYSTREVVTIGGGVPELQSTVRFHKDARELLRMIEFAADGGTVEYFPNLEGAMSFDLDLVHEGRRVAVSADRDRHSSGEYEKRLIWRSPDGSSLSPLYEPWWFKWSAGDAAPDFSASRSSVARYTNHLATSEQAASGAVRASHYVYANDGERYLTALLEGSGTQVLSDSTDLTTANWTETTGASTTGGQPGIIDGETATLVEDDGSGGFANVNQVFGTLTGNDETASIIVEGKDASFTELAIRDQTAGSNIAAVELDWSVGSVTVTVGAGTARVEKLADSGPNGGAVYRIQITDAGTAGNSRRVSIYPTGISRSEAAGVYVHHAQHEEQAFASSPMVATTRDNDHYQGPVLFAPADIRAQEAVTIYSRVVDLGSALQGTSSYLWTFGKSTPPYFAVTGTGTDGWLKLFYDFGDGSTSLSFGAGDIRYLTLLEVRVLIYVDSGVWKTQPFWVIDGGDEQPGSVSTIGKSMPESWSVDSFTIGANYGGSVWGHAAHNVHLVAPGSLSLGESRKLAGA